jgi:hypothetical protein
MNTNKYQSMKTRLPEFKILSPTGRLRAARRALSFAGFGVAALLCGCSMVTYRSPSGERFLRGSLGANTSLTSLAVESDTNGVRRVQMQGYQNDASQALGAVTEAAVKAAVQAAK